MKKLTLVFTLIIGVSSLAASPRKNQPAAESAIHLERGTARRLFILGFSGQVVVSPNPNKKSSDISYRITKYLDPANGSTSEEKNEALREMIVRSATGPDTVEIRVEPSPNRGDWLRWLDLKKAPQAKLEISAPDSMGLEIYWMHGEIKVANWNSSVTVTTQDGREAFDSIAGDLTLKTMFGHAQIENVQGTTSLEGFSNTFAVSGITGKLFLRTFSGESKLKKIVGTLNLSSQKGSLSTQDTNGTLSLQDGAASVHIKDHRGSLVATSETGAVDAQVTGPVNAKLTSVSGSLILRVPHSSKAHVALSTEKGNLYAPSMIESKKTAEGRSARGSLEGAEPGSLRITSESGDVSLKFL